MGLGRNKASRGNAGGDNHLRMLTLGPATEGPKGGLATPTTLRKGPSRRGPHAGQIPAGLTVITVITVVIDGPWCEMGGLSHAVRRDEGAVTSSGFSLVKGIVS